NGINDGNNLPWYAFHKVLPNEEHRLDCPRIARIILKQQIVMFKTAAMERCFDDLVVTMIFALILKCPFRCLAILQLSERNNFDHAVRNRDCVTMLHAETSSMRLG